jgi:nucleoside-diphosphate-sugar epimerase
MTSILVTGANGFVGRAVCARALPKGLQIKGATRQACPLPEGVGNVVVGELGNTTDWRQALQGVDVVIHLAARVHVMRDDAHDPIEAFRQVNMQGTRHLAKAAAAAGVRRMVYVSSIKVNGEETLGEQRFSERDAPLPQDPYGVSKMEAEQALWEVSRETGLQVVILRPPLVYGEGVKGNFERMMRAVLRGWPLPLGAVHNKRDLVYVGNLADALLACAEHPQAAGNTYLVSDGESVTTTELLRALAESMGIASRVFRVPLPILKFLAGMAGRSAEAARLLGSLQIDSGKIRRELNWTPPYTLQQGLQATAAWYRNTHS